MCVGVGSAIRRRKGRSLIAIFLFFLFLLKFSRKKKRLWLQQRHQPVGEERVMPYHVAPVQKPDSKDRVWRRGGEFGGAVERRQHRTELAFSGNGRTQPPAECARDEEGQQRSPHVGGRDERVGL